ncbi:MAG: hypothetical protein KF745_13915 [Phycisphaeraceae bacterium]|nr:hypothetical protein [Phycisphaeraceae bacterium]
MTHRATRLAPSPTGALHLGNARTFLITWAMARRLGWRLVLRIEDLDTPRIKPEAAGRIIETLLWLGIDWDPIDAATPVMVQSHDLEPYRDAMRRLASGSLAYPCSLTRAEIERAGSAPNRGDTHDTPYPSRLRPDVRPLDFDAVNTAAAANADPEAGLGANWRFVVLDGGVRFDDAFAGPQSHDPASSIGDFVLWTKRDQPSYQLAVVVDDHRQGITDVIRADDLLDSASRQLLLYRALSLRPEPRYTHLPLVLGPDGRRLAKRHGDTRIDHYRARNVPRDAVVGLLAAWSGITPRNERIRVSPAEFMQAFELSRLPRSPVTFTTEDDQWLVSQAR